MSFSGINEVLMGRETTTLAKCILNIPTKEAFENVFSAFGTLFKDVCQLNQCLNQYPDTNIDSKTFGRNIFTGSGNEPHTYYDYCNNFDMFIHAFSAAGESQIAVVKAIFGEIPFEGHFPYEEPWLEQVGSTIE